MDQLSPHPSDASKIIYITPRFAGIQLGGSWTPDTDQAGGDNPAAGSGGNDGPGTSDFENVYSIGINYSNTFNDVSIVVAGIYQGGEDEDDTIEDLETWGIGLNVRYAGFEFGAGYADLNETNISVANAALGEDRGSWWDLGLNYKTGPWTVGVGYFHGEKDYVSGSGDADVDVFVVGFDYAVAPSWKIESDIRFIEQDNIDASGVDNDATIFSFATTMSF